MCGKGVHPLQGSRGGLELEVNSFITTILCDSVIAIDGKETYKKTIILVVIWRHLVTIYEQLAIKTSS